MRTDMFVEIAVQGLGEGRFENVHQEETQELHRGVMYGG